jgi:hypothetical protein
VLALDTFELADANDRERSNIRGMKRARSDEIVPSDGALVVDVGGVRYKTTRSTLSSGSGYFEARLNFDGKEDAGELFVDRDGALFHHILTHLRNNGLSRAVTDRLSAETRVALVKEAEYFVIPSLIEQVVVPPVGAAVRFMKFIPLEEDEEEGLLVKVFGKVSAYDHASRTWTVQIIAEFDSDSTIDCYSWNKVPHVPKSTIIARGKVEGEVFHQLAHADSNFAALSEFQGDEELLRMPSSGMWPYEDGEFVWEYLRGDGSWIGRRRKTDRFVSSVGVEANEWLQTIAAELNIINQSGIKMISKARCPAVTAMNRIADAAKSLVGDDGDAAQENTAAQANDEAAA